MITIRKATKDDTRLILQFIKGIAEYEKLSYEVIADEQVLSTSLFNKCAAETLLAFHEGEPAGFCIFFQNFSTFVGKPGIYIEDIFVKPEHRNKGVGKALFRHVAGLAVDRDCGRIEWAVLDWNEDAIGFYRSMGAESMDGWTLYRLDDERTKRVSLGENDTS